MRLGRPRDRLDLGSLSPAFRKHPGSIPEPCTGYYRGTMTYVISHTTALEAMRLADAPRLLAAAEPLDIPDAKAPTKSEADRWLGCSSMGRLLTRPVQMLVADAAGSRDNEVFRSRVLRSELPAGAFRRIGANLAVPCPELLVLQMARLATPLELVLLIEELCGTYAVQPADPSGMLQRKEPLTSRVRILEFVDKLNRPPAAAKVRNACSLAFDASGSPMESRLALRIAWPRRKGGYNVPILSMNEDLEVARIWRGLEESHVRRPDILFSLPHDGAPGYCLDYHGGVHGRDGRAEADAVRANELLAFGLQPFAIWRAQYEGTAYLDRLVDGVLRGKLGLPAHRVTAARRALELARREELLAELDAIDGLSWGVSEKRLSVVKARESVEEALDRLAIDEARRRRSAGHGGFAR